MEGRTFKHMQDLPREIGRMVTEKMDAAERCRYSGCSRMTFIEARDTPNYLYGLELLFSHSEAQQNLRIKVVFAKDQGFEMNFVEEGCNRKCIKMRTLLNQPLPDEELETDLNVFEFGLKSFKQLLHYWGSKIKMLSISGTSSAEQFVNVQFGCQSLRKLESLSICGRDVDPQQFLSVLDFSLKRLEIFETSKYQLSADNEQIYGVTEYLSLPLVSLNYDQLFQLKAKTVRIHIGKLTAEDIYNFIKNWQNGRYTKQVRDFTWMVRNSEIGELLFKLLDKHVIGSIEYPVRIRQLKNIEEGESGIAALAFNAYLLNWQLVDENFVFSEDREEVEAENAEEENVGAENVGADNVVAEDGEEEDIGAEDSEEESEEESVGTEDSEEESVEDENVGDDN